MALSTPVRRQRPGVGIHNRSRSLAGSSFSSHVMRDEPSPALETVREGAEKIAAAWLAKHDKQIRQRSDFTLRAPRDYNGNRFQRYQFDPRMGRGANPRAFERGGFASLKALQSNIVGIFEHFDVDLEQVTHKNSRLGVSFGLLEGDSGSVPRQPTKKTYWIYQGRALDHFIRLLRERRGGDETAKRALIIFYQYFFQGREDKEIRQAFPSVFQTVLEVKSLRQRLVRAGSEMFGEGIVDESWRECRNERIWREFRDEQDAKRGETDETHEPEGSGAAPQPGPEVEPSSPSEPTS